jgi:isopenicillin-N epimerase
MCSPKGSGFLYVDKSRQADIRPLSISHGANSTRTNRSRYQIEFGWTGTWDPTAYLGVPKAIDFIEKLVPGGWVALMKRNCELVLKARELVCQALELDRPCPDSMIGSIASFRLPDGSDEPSDSPLYADPMQQILREKYAVEVPIIPWPAPPRRLLRISAQYYNTLEDYHRLSVALKELFRK